MNIRYVLAFAAVFCAALPLSAQVREHIVQDNQTLYSIARMYQTTVNNLIAWNRLSSERIRAGQKLVVAPAASEGGPIINDPGTYIVRTGDTLEIIASRYGLRPDDLARLNALDSSRLVPGTRLLVRPSMTPIHRVQEGETAHRLSLMFGLSLEDFLAINSLRSPSLRPGQLVRVSRPPTLPLTHEVLEMDSLESLAALYGVTVEDLRSLNSLESDRLIPGQMLRLKAFQSASIPHLRPVGPGRQSTPAPNAAISQIESTPQGVWHTIALGETLFSLSRRYRVSVENLREWNGLRDNTIRVGQRLRVSPEEESTDVTPLVPEPVTPTETPAARLERLIDIRPHRENEELRWDRYVVLQNDIPLFEWQNDFYYFAHLGRLTQPSNRFYEDDWRTPLEAYRRAARLWSEFKSLVNAKPQKSRILEGVTFVLDPGHGGLDPGAIVRGTDGGGETLYITEDEYVYDIALRMVPLLVEHGARVEFTILAPNHLIRDTTPATRTLIHEKNEVYNNETLNATNRVTDWIRGGAEGLAKRVRIANDFFDKAEGVKVFLSIHADNNPRAPMGLGLWLDPGDTESEVLARSMLPFLGSQAYIRHSPLAVLRRNNSDYRILAEVRNAAFQEHAWALRFADTRQLDAERLTRGITNFFQQRRRSP